jgi:NADP-dependent 3-hydroxy acid dehydrogenase YdfG
MEQYKNKVAVVTGAASGIGKAIATKCLQLGMKVVLVDVDAQKLAQTSSLLKSISDSLLTYVINVADEEAMNKLAKSIFAIHNRVDYLFNNAGIAGALTPIWEQSTNDIQDVMQVNIMGTIHGIKAFVPMMLQQENECYVINTAAGAGLLTGAGLGAYKASKHAIIAISEVLLADLQQISATIQVSVLISHLVATNMPSSIKTNDPTLVQQHLKQLSEFGMDPSFVAEKLFEGISAKKFYIFTQPQVHLPKIKKRLESILASEAVG